MSPEQALGKELDPRADLFFFRHVPPRNGDRQTSISRETAAALLDSSGAFCGFGRHLSCGSATGGHPGCRRINGKVKSVAPAEGQDRGLHSER